MATGDQTFTIRNDVYSDTTVLQVTIEGFAGKATTLTYDFTGCTLSVSDPGYSAAATATTQVRTINVRDIFRVPGTTADAEADSASDLVVNLSLSDFVYTGSTSVTATMAAGWATDGGDSTTATAAQSVTNSSTRAYPKPGGMWNVEHDYCVTDLDGLLPVSFFAAHRLFSGRTPVAGVRFSASDGVNPAVTSDVSTLTTTSYTASGLFTPTYDASLDLSGLNTGEITVDVIIYPLIGTSFTLSTDASAHPSANLSVLKAVNNYNNGYGVSYAYVTATGDDGTGVVSLTAATAEASPFASIGAATTACRTYNNTTYTRDTVSNSRVRIDDSTYIHVDISSRPVDLAPLFIEAAEVADKLTSIYQEPAANNTDGLPDKIVFKNIRVQKITGSNRIAFDSNNGAGSAGFNAFVNVDFHDTISSGNSYGAWIYRPGRLYVYECSGNVRAVAGVTGTVNKALHLIGSDGYFFGASLFMALGSYTLSGGFSDKGVNAAREASIGTVLAFNFFGVDAASGSSVNLDGEITDRGYFQFNNVIEHKGGDTSPGAFISGDSIVTPALNACIGHNTIVGSRYNGGYQDDGTVVYRKEITSKHDIMLYRNTKGDLFPTISANRVGNWDYMWNTGCRNLITLQGSNNGSSYGPDDWLGEVAAEDDQTGSSGTPLVADFVDDASFSGDDSGGGDYTLGASTEIVKVSTSTFAYPVDLYGNIVGTGTNYPGAMVESASSGGDGGGQRKLNIGLGIGL